MKWIICIICLYLFSVHYDLFNLKENDKKIKKIVELKYENQQKEMQILQNDIRHLVIGLNSLRDDITKINEEIKKEN